MSLAALFIVSALAAPPKAAPCLPAAKKELAEASPGGVAAAWEKLNTCDAAAAKTVLPDALKRAIPGPAANALALKGLDLGLTDAVTAWLPSLEPDQRASAVGFFGEKCNESAAAEGYFVASFAASPVKFAENRYLRAVASCKKPAIRELLDKAVTTFSDGTTYKDRTQFLAAVDAYARNAGGEAVPRLEALLTSVGSAEEESYVITAFASAARLGSAEGTDVDAAQKSVIAIVKSAPALKPNAIDQARQTLSALGAVEEADLLAKYRWPERKGDKGYRYAASASQVITCKNGKQQAWLHIAPLAEAGNFWPEQLEQRFAANLSGLWAIDAAAKKCKGTAEVHWEFPAEPFADDAGRDGWITVQKKAFETAQAAVPTKKVVVHEAVEL